MNFIKATLEHGGDSGLVEGTEYEVTVSSISAFRREKDKTVVFCCTNGLVFRTGINVNSVRDQIAAG